MSMSMSTQTTELRILLCGTLIWTQACSDVALDQDGEAEIESALLGRSPRWVPLGGSVDPEPGQKPLLSSLVAAPRLSPVVAFSRLVAPGRFDTLASRWTGDHWLPLGEPIESGYSIFALDPSRRIYRCVMRDPPINGLFVKRWNGSRWIAVGGEVTAEAGNPTGRSPSCKIVLRGDDHPIVSWEVVERTSASLTKTYLAEWDKECKKWKSLPAPPLGRESIIALDVDEQSRLYALSRQTFDFAYERDNNIWRWDGQEWSRFGTTLRSTDERPALALHGSTPYLVFNTWLYYSDESSLDYTRVVRWERGAWRDLPSPGRGFNLALKLTESGTPVVGYVERTETPFTRTIRMKYFTGNTWSELGTGFTEGLRYGLSLDARGRAIVAWQKDPEELSAILVARYSSPLP